MNEPLRPPAPPDRPIIATVTLNPAFDRTLYLPTFRMDTLNRVERVTLQASGKGVNVARALARLGVPTICLGIVAGDAGHALQTHLVREGLATNFVEADSTGETRTNITLVVAGRRIETKINEPGPTVTTATLDQLAARVAAVARQAFVVVFSGSLPPGAPADTYARLIDVAQTAGALAVLDADGEPLRLGLAARPFLIKPNQREAERLLGRPLTQVRQVIDAASELTRSGTVVLVTLGGRGAVLATRPSGRTAGADCWRISTPRVRVINTVGAGDAFLAGFLAGVYRGIGAADALRLATESAWHHLGAGIPSSATALRVRYFPSALLRS